MADATPIRKAVDPITDSSFGFGAPKLNFGMSFRDYGSYGLRQFAGWIKEEYLLELTGREGARTYREMMDNSSVVGAMMFALQQAMRKADWRCEAADDSADSQKLASFADSLREDMSHTWEDFMTEALSMLGFGYSIHEIVYKRRLGEEPPKDPTDPKGERLLPTSKFDDGFIGWRRLPIRGQETIIKWFFDENGQVTGVTQQPWVGALIDIPIDKFLLFRPQQHKNNPEGRSVLRNAYRSYYFIKRLEELEAILFERMGGFPVMYVPTKLIDAANSLSTDPDAQAARAAYDYYKKLVTGTRIDEQMGAVLPSDTYRDADGKTSAIRMYEFKLVTPERGQRSFDSDKVIQRHQVEMLMTLLADFIHMGHEVRGTNNLAVTRVDMFYGAIEGWLHSIAGVINLYGLPRLWKMNNFDRAALPQFVPDMPQRLDLDSLGAFIKNMASAGMPMFPNEELEDWIRGAAGMPDLEASDPDVIRAGGDKGPIDPSARARQQIRMIPRTPATVKAMMKSFLAREVLNVRGAT